MSAFTPGPWKVRGVDVYGAGVKVTECPSRLTIPGSGAAYERATANARLIAASPDLLAALRAYVAACREQGLNLGAITGDAEAAIAKAEGQTS